MRNDSVARLFVRSANSIRCFILEDCGDFWQPKIEQAANYKS
jgi:hypothetical protein